MGTIVGARAYANNEVAFIAWDADGKIPGCLGFEVTRIYLDASGADEERVPLAAWVAFKGQSNPEWKPQNTSVWPIQKFGWRDLTLRKRRNRPERRVAEADVRYEIRPVGRRKPGLPPVEPEATGSAYVGTPIPLSYLSDAVSTNPVHVTTRRGDFESTFTNGILSGQWLRRVLTEDDGKIGDGELMAHLETPGDFLRRYLAGDVLPLMKAFLDAPGGRLLAALYELEDAELVELLVRNAARLSIVLANTGADEAGVWDQRNRKGRDALIAAGADIQHRMFNSSKHIGHNKFVVRLDDAGQPTAVLTGSTNWTATGLCGQTNNAAVVHSPVLAGLYRDYYDRLRADVLPSPSAFGDPNPAANQGAAFRSNNARPYDAELGDGSRVTLWFSPNTKSGSKTKTSTLPPDLEQVYSAMRKAEDAILFLAFYPAQGGLQSIVEEAVAIGLKDRSLLVRGAVSSAQAMPNYRPAKKDKATGKLIEPAFSPATFEDVNVSIVRAARIDDAGIVGDFLPEVLSAGRAIIHDKVMVIDPLSDDCVVVFGSHNLGFKASYANDENLLIVRGNRSLAEAYAVHVLDVYDHYRFRAVETDLKREGKEGWDGFLDTNDRWQDRYAEGLKGSVSRYFARPWK